MDSITSALDSFVTDPRYAEYLALFKSARNGAVYGAKVRFPHALVYGPHFFPPNAQGGYANIEAYRMVFLFRSGSVRDKLSLIYKATRTHARNLATFAFLYKTSMLFLRRASPAGKEVSWHTFAAGLVGGYYVFGRGIQSSVNQQIVIYVFARVMLALAKITVQKRDQGGFGVGWAMRERIQRNAWPVFASLSWAMVMWIFRWHPDTIQPSLKSSMKYIYVDSDQWDNFRTFLLQNK